MWARQAFTDNLNKYFTYKIKLVINRAGKCYLVALKWRNAVSHKVKPEQCSEWSHSHGPPMWVIHWPRQAVGSLLKFLLNVEVGGSDVSPTLLLLLLTSPLLTFTTPAPKGIPVRLCRCPSHLGLTRKEVGTCWGEKNQEEEEWGRE